MSQCPSTTAEWCRLLSAPGAPVVMIGPDNRSLGTATLQEALASRVAFAISIRADVVAADIDDGRPLVLASILKHLDEVGQEHLLIESGRVGHHHLLVPCGSESAALSTVRRLRECVASLVDADVTVLHRCYLRPPGAPHRLGHATSPHPVAATPRAIDALQSSNPTPWQRRTIGAPVARRTSAVNPTPSGVLDATTYSLLVDGDGIDRYRSRSEAVFALCCGMYRAGWTEAEALEALDNTAHRGGEPWRSILRGEPGRSGQVRHRPRRWLRRVWAAAARAVDDSPSHPGSRSSEHVDGAASDWLWSVESAVRESHRRRLATVMLVASHLAGRCSPADLRCAGSLRSIAEACCLDPGTVQTALALIESLGFLERLSTGRVELSGGGTGRTTASWWRLVTVSGMGGTTPPGGGCGARRRTALPEEYRSIEASLAASARWLLMEAVDRELTLDDCAERVAMSPRSLLLAQKDRIRGGALRQMLDLGVVQATARGTFVARPQPTRKAATAARRVVFHGRRATDRPRRMAVRHQRQRSIAVTHLEAMKRSRMLERVAGYYVDTRGLTTAKALQIAEATVRRRRGGEPAGEVRSGRQFELADDSGNVRKVTVGPSEIVVRPGDSSITRRVTTAGCRKIWVLRYPYLGALRPVWQVWGRVVLASRLAEAVADLDGWDRRLRRVIPHPGDLAAALEELAPLARN